MTLKRKLDLTSKATKQKCIDEIIYRVNEAVDDEIGMITAEEVLELVTENIASEIYDQAVEDVKKLLAERQMDINIEIDLLKSKG
jgi:uncharacterized protein (DUF2164 family)